MNSRRHVTLEQLSQAQPYKPHVTRGDFEHCKIAVLEALLIDAVNGGSGVSTPDLRARGGGERPPNRVKDLRDEDHHLIETITGRPFRFKLLHLNLSAIPEKLLPLAQKFCAQTSWGSRSRVKTDNFGRPLSDDAERMPLFSGTVRE